MNSLDSVGSFLVLFLAGLESCLNLTRTEHQRWLTHDTFDAKYWLVERHGQEPAWERLRAEGEGSNRGWDGWKTSLTHEWWVSENSWRWWRTGKPGLLQSMESQRVRHDWATKKQQIGRLLCWGQLTREGTHGPCWACHSMVTCLRGRVPRKRKQEITIQRLNPESFLQCSPGYAV